MRLAVGLVTFANKPSHLIQSFRPFFVVFFFAFVLPMPPKSRAEAAASRAARAAARSNRSPAAATSPATHGDTPGGARTPPFQLALQAAGTAATSGTVASVVSPDDLAGFPPLGADASGSAEGGIAAPAPSGGRASGAGGRARKSRGGRSSAAKGAKPRVDRRQEPGAADSDASTVVLSMAPSPSAVALPK